MYTRFNAKKERRRTKVEKLQDEIKKLHQMLGAMIHVHEKLKVESHVHERLKNERIEGSKTAKLPTLSAETSIDCKSTEETPITLLGDTNREPTPGKDQKGA